MISQSVIKLCTKDMTRI